MTQPLLPLENALRVQVAVGILINAQGQYLFTSRPKGKAYAGYWEFPGGKLEAGETADKALERELFEELGIRISYPQLWKTLPADYPHASVLLHIFKVRQWSGALQMREGQNHSWQCLPTQLGPMLPSNIAIIGMLQK